MIKKFLSNLVQIICATIIFVTLVSFLYFLFDMVSFSSSIKNTVETSCNTIVAIFQNNNSETELLTVEELRSATDYIIKAGEYFSVASNNNIISIIYAFATTVILTAGAFVLGKISQKSKKIEDDLQKFNKKSKELKKETKYTEKRIVSIKKSYSQLLDFQNITSYMLYSTMLIYECEKNLEKNADNFKLLNDIINKLKMIPNEYNSISSDDMEDKFGNEYGCRDFGRSLSSNFVEFKNKYKGLIKRYISIHSETDPQYKNAYTEINYICINDIIDDILNKQNSGFFEIK